MDKLLITNARILDPSCQPPLDFVGDILMEGERIVKVGAELSRMEIAKDAKVIDACRACAPRRDSSTSTSICVTRDLPTRRISSPAAKRPRRAV